MAIEPLVIDSRPALNSERKSGGVDSGQQSLLDKAKELREKEGDKKAEDKDAEQRSDRVSLSQNALEVLSSRESLEANNQRNFDPSITQAAEQSAIREENNQNFVDRLKRTQELAVELTGISEFEKNNNLSDSQVLRSQNLRSELSNLLDISDSSEELIRDITSRVIQDITEEVRPILSKISNGFEVTGDEFAKVNEADELLNKANGFGIEGFNQISNSEQQRLEGLKSQSESFLELKSEDILAPNELDYVQRLQKEISTIEGYRLNIKNSIGPEGVII